MPQAGTGKSPRRYTCRYYRDGATHEFRHVFVSKGHMYGRKKTDGADANNRVYAWMKYVAKAQASQIPH